MLMLGQGDGGSGEVPRTEPQEMPEEARRHAAWRHAALLTVYELNDAGEDADGDAGAARSVVVADRREVQQHTHAEPERVRRRYMTGDSMRATITPNTQCYCVPVKRFEGHGIYYFTVDGQPLIARLQAVGGGAWLIKYDNDSYDDELLLPDDEDPASDIYVSKRTGRTVRLRILERVRSFVMES